MGVLTKGKYTFGNKTKAQIANLTAPVSKTGTLVSVGTAVTGTGTAFTTELWVGCIIRCASQTAIVTTITDDTNLVIDVAQLNDFAGETYTVMNAIRAKEGDSVFNITDRIAMYYSGDGYFSWTKGEFCSGQTTPIRNAYGNGTLLEGEVLEPSDTVGIGMVDYDGTIDHALGVAYHTVYGGNCMPLAVVGIHNTDTSDTITKTEFVVPDASTSSVDGDGTTEASDQVGVACTASGTPTAGEVEILLNFTERL